MEAELLLATWNSLGFGTAWTVCGDWVCGVAALALDAFSFLLKNFRMDIDSVCVCVCVSVIVFGQEPQRRKCIKVSPPNKKKP